MPSTRLKLFAAGAALWLAASVASPAYAHCDGLDGPVVTAARQALEAGDPSLVLIWVQPDDEAAVRAAFAESLAVRRLGRQARELADRSFFETVVRLHRAAEGAPYAGLQPAGRDLGPAIPLADAAVASGSDAEVTALLAEAVTHGVRERLAALRQKRGFARGDLAAGRAYVADYVAFIHYVEAIHAAATASNRGHYPEAAAEQHGDAR
jgi:hypothetical protein